MEAIDLGFNQVYFVARIIFQHVEALNSILDVHTHFYENLGKLIEILGLVFPKRIAICHY